MLESQLEVLAQSRAYLSLVTPELYVQVLRPQFMSSAGSHVRHVLDHYNAIRAARQLGFVDYDARSRGGQLERSPEAALDALVRVEEWLHTLDAATYETAIPMRTQVSVSARRIVSVPTTLAREIVFAGSHAVHHLAMVAQISKHQGLPVDAWLGVAPATATYLRERACAR